MLLGQAESTISSKKQVAFPKRFQKIVGNTFILTKGIEKHLLLVANANWEVLLEGTKGNTFLDKNTREFTRFLLGNSIEIKLDKKGRFIIPSYLREYAELTKDIVFVGVDTFVEVWDKKKWLEYQDFAGVSIAAVAQRISKEQRHE